MHQYSNNAYLQFCAGALLVVENMKKNAVTWEMYSIVFFWQQMK